MNRFFAKRANRKRRGKGSDVEIGNQRRSWRTLCCEVLASASADTAIDWRVDSAWLLAASSLESANVRLAEPVCSTLVRFVAKSWRICTIDKLEPSAEASDRNWSEAAVTLAITALAELLSRKSVPAVSGPRPRPAASKVTPGTLSVDLPVSLKVSFRSSPHSRLIPLKEESCDVVVICVMMLLYWLTRLARIVCEFGSTTGVPLPATIADAVVPVNETVLAAAAPEVVVDWLALSLFEVKVSKPVTLIDAVTPMPAAEIAAFSALSELTFPAPATLLKVSVRAGPVAGVRITVLPCREVVPPVVRSPAVPTAPAVVVTLAFVV